MKVVFVGHLFESGKLCITPGAAAVFEMSENINGLSKILMRHCSGDWGDVSDDDKELNDQSVADGTRIMSQYTVDGDKVWIITEADRSSTTILLPEEY